MGKDLEPDDTNLESVLCQDMVCNYYALILFAST